METIPPLYWAHRHKIELWVSFPMQPVWGQSASYRRSYACFTEEWPVCLARGSCRGDEGLSIDGSPLPSIDGDAKTWAKHYFKTDWNPEATQIYQNTHGRPETLFMLLLTAMLSKLSLIHSSRLGEKGGTPSESFWNSFGFYILIYCNFLSIHLWFQWQTSCLNRSTC